MYTAVPLYANTRLPAPRMNAAWIRQIGYSEGHLPFSDKLRIPGMNTYTSLSVRQVDRIVGHIATP